MSCANWVGPNVTYLLIVFEYDVNRLRVKVVDKSFLLWKQFQELPELLEYIDLEELTEEFV